MAETGRHTKSKVICVNIDEETQRLLSSVKNKSGFIREAVKDKFIYEKFREEYTHLKEEFKRIMSENEKLRSENERIRLERKKYEEKIKELTRIKEEYERNAESQKHQKQEKEEKAPPIFLMTAEKPEKVNEKKKPKRIEPFKVPEKIELSELSQKQSKTISESDMMKVSKEEIAGVKIAGVNKEQNIRKEKEAGNKRISTNIIKGAKEIYNKYKKYKKSAIIITERYLQKRGINDRNKINEIIEVIKNSR